MTKKEILEKLEKMSPEQRDFIVKEIDKHSERKKENSPNKETFQEKQKKKI